MDQDTAAFAFCLLDKLKGFLKMTQQILVPRVLNGYAAVRDFGVLARGPAQPCAEEEPTARTSDVRQVGIGKGRPCAAVAMVRGYGRAAVASASAGA